MTFLDYLCEKKEQKEHQTRKWLEYKTECQKHFEKNKDEIISFFYSTTHQFISFEKLEITPFNDIPRFLKIFPHILSLEYYFDAIGIEYEFVHPSNKLVFSDFKIDKSGYLVKNPF